MVGRKRQRPNPSDASPSTADNAQVPSEPQPANPTSATSLGPAASDPAMLTPNLAPPSLRGDDGSDAESQRDHSQEKTVRNTSGPSAAIDLTDKDRSIVAQGPKLVWPMAPAVKSIRINSCCQRKHTGWNCESYTETKFWHVGTQKQPGELALSRSAEDDAFTQQNIGKCNDHRTLRD
jgi:hypothetical protein